ncbi:hypothetical protein SLNSH_22120 [Alsobacter soli]|uniref:Uncharacterized protein n=1 Tax=Alsobacter soli TaxID=2109933 RepID=A0A2T1HML2_9HYPH|nr:hypothetical protein [Alsobacter soli]PSC02819.1 hypothetical protein SLNSH_22120 [Alsobacter soli]
MNGWTTASLWLAVLSSGLYHGVNPGMGWPLAVSAAWMGEGRRELLPALAALAAGHFLAMAVILLPFAAMAALVTWEREIRGGAGLAVLGVGILLLANRRHPRFLARIEPTRLAFWSFAAATAHGAGLMLVPIYLGLCRPERLDDGHRAAGALMAGNAAVAVQVAAAHAVVMIVSGGVLALAVHAWLGPQYIRRAWFNLDVAWPLSLVLVGGIGLAASVSGT